MPICVLLQFFFADFLGIHYSQMYNVDVWRNLEVAESLLNWRKLEIIGSKLYIKFRPQLHNLDIP